MTRPIVYALLAAALFGASTPFAKLLLGDVSPWLLAGLLYLGSGIGLGGYRVVRDGQWKPSGLTPGEWPWLAGAIVFGGVLGPLALMFGLSRTPGAAASLLLNLEAVLTAVLAWCVFREATDRRVVLGMVAIVIGGLLLSWSSSAGHDAGSLPGPLAIVLACLCWAIDNNLTSQVSAADAVFIASVKGAVAGGVNVAQAVMLGAGWPSAELVGATLLVGLLGYGVSLVMFVLALRGLGTARTGAYFSTAPFIGAALSLVMLDEVAGPGFWWATGFMAIGVWLHLSERHEHVHTHEATAHRHMHVHDAHHQHAHEPETPPGEPHEHWHRHEPVTHKHPHFPDIHHRHSH